MIEIGDKKETSHSPNQPSDESDPTLNGAMGSNLSQLETATAVKNLNEITKRVSNEGTLGQMDFLNTISYAIGIAETNLDKTRYFKDGGFTLRIANHRANALTFEQRGERTGNTSIVIKMSKKDSAHIKMCNSMSSFISLTNLIN